MGMRDFINRRRTDQGAPKEPEGCSLPGRTSCPADPQQAKQCPCMEHWKG